MNFLRILAAIILIGIMVLNCMDTDVQVNDRITGKSLFKGLIITPLLWCIIYWAINTVGIFND